MVRPDHVQIVWTRARDDRIAGEAGIVREKEILAPGSARQPAIVDLVARLAVRPDRIEGAVAWTTIACRSVWPQERTESTVNLSSCA
jgi:hypothetical protein